MGKIGIILFIVAIFFGFNQTTIPKREACAMCLRFGESCLSNPECGPGCLCAKQYGSGICVSD